jgi:hypothetical protein
MNLVYICSRIPPNVIVYPCMAGMSMPEGSVSSPRNDPSLQLGANFVLLQIAPLSFISFAKYKILPRPYR